MSDIGNKIKKVVEKNSNLNLKSTKDRAILIKQLGELIPETKTVEVVGQSLGDVDMFEFKQKVTADKAEKKKKRETEGISRNPELNPMHGFVDGQVAKMVTHNRDIEEYYEKLSKKEAKEEKNKRAKKAKPKTKKPTLDEIKKMKIEVPEKPVVKRKGNLSRLGKSSPRN